MIGVNTSAITETLQIQAKTDLINSILEESSNYLKGSQLMELNKTLNKYFQNYEIFTLEHRDLHENYKEENEQILEIYLSNKKLEGLSPRTLDYYEGTINKFIEWVDKPLSDVTTQDIRDYFTYFQGLNNCSAASVDNIRRNLNSFFNTISNEGYIQNNPMVRIKKIKAPKKVKKPYTELEVEKMRNVLNNLPENTPHQKYNKCQKQALFELLLSSGIRLNECVQLNKLDIDLDNRTFIVLGKGNKERVCYFSVKAQFYLDKLINFKFTGKTKKFKDKEALFLSTKTAKRLMRTGIERHIRELGRSVGVKAYPHKFRRTFATNLVNKGVPIEQIRELMGHANMDTTLIYAIVDQDNIKHNHNKYVG